MAVDRTKAVDRAMAIATGPVKGASPGRLDDVDTSVPPGAYVIPADVVSALGDGNSEAGHALLDKMFPPAGPDEVAHFKRGGAIPVKLSHGEHVITPQQIRAKFGDVQQGQAALDQFVLDTRKQNVDTLQKLPPPAQD